MPRGTVIVICLAVSVTFGRTARPDDPADQGRFAQVDQLFAKCDRRNMDVWRTVVSLIGVKVMSNISFEAGRGSA